MEARIYNEGTFVNIFALLCKENPDSPYGLERANEFIENREVYNEKAKLFTHKYGNIMSPNYNKHDSTKDWDFEI